jgi:protein-S-isoprenylcysteine O-methyltransferase Ste14
VRVVKEAANRLLIGVLTFARHLLAFLALPFVVAVVIPVWIARRNGVGFGLRADAAGRLAQLLGVAVGLVGLWLFVFSLLHFARRGRGTLAPWDPPKRLVVSGPYRYVRNPMISGVIFVLFAEALLLTSRPHATWAVTFLVINLVYIPLLEEPMLDARFGESYREYKQHVRRFVPRLRPWKGDEGTKKRVSLG